MTSNYLKSESTLWQDMLTVFEGGRTRPQQVVKVYEVENDPREHREVVVVDNEEYNHECI